MKMQREPWSRKSLKAAAILLAAPLMLSCGGSGAAAGTGSGTTAGATPAQAPTFSAAAALGGAQIVTLQSATPGAAIYYTLDGSTPTTASTLYQAPFLVDSSLTVKALATASGDAPSTVSSQNYTVQIASGTLVWSDEFSNAGSANAQPNPAVWTYDTGNSGWGNNELEDYCAWGSNASPCNAAAPNAYVGTDSALHIVAQQPAPGTYTSARLKSQGLFSFQYGRVEARIQLPEQQGFWPAFWMLGNNIATVNWPACGEMDIAERVDAATTPDYNKGSVHGTGFTGTNLGLNYNFPSGQTAAGWHTYGMIWKPGSVAYYIDDPTHPYATFTTSSISSLSGSVWPFDSGPSFFILNLAVGGNWPGAPTASTTFPAQIVVDYVRIYTN